MKTLVLMALLPLMSMAQNNPKAPIRITCEQEDGETRTVRVMRVYFDSKTGRATGMHFGPNRGDEGFFELNGNCEIRFESQSDITSKRTL